MSTLFWLVVTALAIIPLYKLLPRFGVSQYWAFVAALAGGVLVLLWVMSMRADRIGAPE